MNKEDFLLCGQVRKTFGYKGEVVVVLHKQLPFDVENLEYFFLETHFGLVPFQIEEISSSGREAWLVKFTDVSSDAEATAIKDFNLYVPLEGLEIPDEEEMLPAAMLTGSSVVDKVSGSIGLVVGIMEMKEQSLLEVKSGSLIHLIPLVEAMILRFDHKKRIIHTQLPEGLLELNEG
jgi:16S rRNA processing protein RimM